MRRLALLGLCVTLSGCEFSAWHQLDFVAGQDPYLPREDSENMRRAMGIPVQVQPMAPEPGQVWPPPPTAEPTELTNPHNANRAEMRVLLRQRTSEFRVEMYQPIQGGQQKNALAEHPFHKLSFRLLNRHSVNVSDSAAEVSCACLGGMPALSSLRPSLSVSKATPSMGLPVFQATSIPRYD